MIDSVLDELAQSQLRIAAAMRRHAETKPSQAGEWSTSEVAAHLAASERECFEPRIKAIATGEGPHFGFYSNDGRDFSQVPLEASLAEWAATRKRVIDLVKGLAPAQLAMTAKHDVFGEITIGRYLEIALEHDREHVADLEGRRLRRARAVALPRGAGHD